MDMRVARSLGSVHTLNRLYRLGKARPLARPYWGWSVIEVVNLIHTFFDL